MPNNKNIKDTIITKLKPPNNNDNPKKSREKKTTKPTEKKAKETSTKNQTKITELFKPKLNTQGSTSGTKTHKKDTDKKSDQIMQGDKIVVGNSSSSTDNTLIANQNQECMMLKPSRIFQAHSASPDLEKVNTAIILPTNNLL